MPLGAWPAVPWIALKKPIPFTRTAMLVAWSDVVGVYLASNSMRAFRIAGEYTLVVTQRGSGIATIIVLPEASWITRW